MIFILLLIYLSKNTFWIFLYLQFWPMKLSKFVPRYWVSVNHFFPLLSGMIHNWTEFFVEVVCCKYKLGKYKTKDILANNSSDTAPVSLTDNASSHIPNVNLFPSTPSWPSTNTTRICLDDDHFKIYIYFLETLCCVLRSFIFDLWSCICQFSTTGSYTHV